MEIAEKMMDVALVEKKMVEINTQYVKQIRKIFSHYCISLSNVVAEATKLKKFHTKIKADKHRMSEKKIQLIVS
jgi:hypothetical protein